MIPTKLENHNNELQNKLEMYVWIKALTTVFISNFFFYYLSKKLFNHTVEIL